MTGLTSESTFSVLTHSSSSWDLSVSVIGHTSSGWWTWFVWVQFLFSSTFDNASVNIFIFSLQSAIFHQLCTPASPKSSPWRPVHTFPTISLWLRWYFASSTAPCTANCLSVRRVTTALRTQSSDEIWTVIGIRALVTMDSSFNTTNSSYSFASRPYMPTLEKEGGILSHFPAYFAFHIFD